MGDTMRTGRPPRPRGLQARRSDGRSYGRQGDARHHHHDDHAHHELSQRGPSIIMGFPEEGGRELVEPEEAYLRSTDKDGLETSLRASGHKLEFLD